MELDVSPFAEVQSAHSKAPVKRAVPHTGDYHKGKIFFNETRTYGPFCLSFIYCNWKILIKIENDVEFVFKQRRHHNKGLKQCFVNNK